MKGLSNSQVLENRKKYGKNELPQEKLKTALDFLIETFQNKLNLILLILSIIFIIFAALGHASFVEPLGIIIVLIIISFLNVKTGLRSQKNAKILKDKSSVRFLKVLREDEIVQIDSRELVVGDIAILQQGEAIFADGFLIDGNIKVNNAVLNGETKECVKTPIKDFEYKDKENISGSDFVDQNSLFAGMIVTEGEGMMLVKKVGINTVSGKTLLLMQQAKPPKTLLEIQLEKLAGQISFFGYVGSVFIAIVLLYLKISKIGFSEFFAQDTILIVETIFAIIVTSITIIVAAVPEGLPLIVNLITSQNAKRMLKHNVLAKNTNKIPEAGSIELLCTDKTGTITKGELLPTDVVLLNGNNINKCEKLYDLFKQSVATNTGSLFDANGKIIGGNATDRAILSIITKNEFEDIKENLQIVRKLIFDSKNKYSAVQVKKGKETITFYKGAPEKFLKVAKTFESEEGKQSINFQEVGELIKSHTSKASRVVAIGVSHEPLSEELPKDLSMLCFVVIRDEIRKEAKEAVVKMKEAGVLVMMITGDQIDTANAIAKEVGILEKQSDLSFVADELLTFSDEKLKSIIKDIKVIARATPEIKLRIIQVAQSLNLCVGMTGDGTNDAPALRASNVGFSMGSGTDLCKEAGDIIITDDNFVSIKQAVLLGRTFMHNVKKFIKFQLPINISMVIICLLFPIFLNVESFVAVQILIINIVMDTLVSISFGGEPPKEEYMKEPPLKRESALITKDMLVFLCFSIFYFVCAFLITLIPDINETFFSDSKEYLTARFLLIIFIANFNGLNIRTNSLNLLKGILKNKNFIKIFVWIFIGAFVLVNYLGEIISCVPLSSKQWEFILLLSIMIIPYDMIRKIIFRK